jgi:hypothetical protein
VQFGFRDERSGVIAIRAGTEEATTRRGHGADGLLDKLPVSNSPLRILPWG